MTKPLKNLKERQVKMTDTIESLYIEKNNHGIEVQLLPQMENEINISRIYIKKDNVNILLKFPTSDLKDNLSTIIKDIFEGYLDD